MIKNDTESRNTISAQFTSAKGQKHTTVRKTGNWLRKSWYM